MDKEKSNFTDRIIAGIRSLTSDLEHLKVQIALGKAEAKDLFEDIKKDFRQEINKAQDQVNKLKSDEHVVKFINAIEHLQVQLALGKAESAEVFNEQLKKIRTSVNELERNIESNQTFKDLLSDVKFEVEKFRIKLELIELHFKLNKIKAEYNFEDKKAEFLAGVDRLKEKLQEKEIVAKDKFEHFRSEMNQAISHLKKAFQ